MAICVGGMRRRAHARWGGDPRYLSGDPLPVEQAPGPASAWACPVCAVPVPCRSDQLELAARSLFRNRPARASPLAGQVAGTVAWR